MLLMRKDQCMHCEEPGCLIACPADGAIVQYANGIVDFKQDQVHRLPVLRHRLPVQHPEIQPGHARRSTSARSALTASARGWSPPASRRAPPAACTSAPRKRCWTLADKRAAPVRAQYFATRCGRLRSRRRRRNARDLRAGRCQKSREIRWPSQRPNRSFLRENVERPIEVGRRPGHGAGHRRGLRALRSLRPKTGGCRGRREVQK